MIKHKKPLIFIVLIILAVTFYGGYKIIKKYKASVSENQKIIELQKVNNEEEKQIESNTSPDSDSQQEIASLPSSIPDRIKISVPFTSQAPLGNWDQFHEEACEETTLIMLKYYLNNVGNAHVRSLTKDTAENEIQKMIAFEIRNYGDYKDSNAQQIVRLAHDFYGISNLKVIYDFTREDIKKYLARGKPIIVPAAGRDLDNPYFTAPGPLYHNLVLVGYDGDNIITNDPGTKHGAGYIYNIDILYNAIHDFPGQPEDIEKGRKAMIVME